MWLNLMSANFVILIKYIFRHSNSSGSLVVLYSASWADQCNQILAVMEQLSKQDAYKSVQFLNVAIEELPEIAKQHEIEAVPTVRKDIQYQAHGN